MAKDRSPEMLSGPNVDYDAEGRSEGLTWLIKPSGEIRVSLSDLHRAEALSSETLAKLEQHLRDIQKATRQARTAQRTCPKLKTCKSFSGECPSLTDCGTY